MKYYVRVYGVLTEAFSNKNELITYILNSKKTDRKYMTVNSKSVTDKKGNFLAWLWSESHR